MKKSPSLRTPRCKPNWKPLAAAATFVVVTSMLPGNQILASPKDLGTKPVVANSSPGEVLLTPRSTARAVGIDSRGGFVAIWQDENRQARTKAVYARAFGADGSPRGPEVPISVNAEGGPDGASVAVAPSGRALVVWTEVDVKGKSGRHILAQRLGVDGRRQGTVFRVNTPGRGRQSDPGVAAANDETFAVVWTGVVQRDWGMDAVFARRFDSSGLPLTNEIRVTEESEIVPGNASVVSMPDGSVTVVFKYSQSAPRHVYLRRFDAAGQPLGAKTRVNASEATVLGRPSVAANSEGTLLAVSWNVFSETETDGSHVLLRVFDGRGRPRTPEIQVDTNTGYWINGSPTVSFAGRDRILVGWDSADGGEIHRALGRYFSNEGRPEHSVPFWIDAGAPGHHRGVSIAANPAGDVAAVWSLLPDQGRSSILVRPWVWPRRRNAAP